MIYFVLNHGFYFLLRVGFEYGQGKVNYGMTEPEGKDKTTAGAELGKGLGNLGNVQGLNKKMGGFDTLDRFNEGFYIPGKKSE